MTSRLHLNPLLYIRGLACLMIIWRHVVPPTHWVSIFGVDLSFISNFSGSFGVFIFYVLSGYSIGYGFFSGRYHTSSLKNILHFFTEDLSV